MINWGDGTTTPGVITDTRGTISVSGTHTYASSGRDAVTVILTDDAPGTATATAHSTATVTGAATALAASANSANSSSTPTVSDGQHAQYLALNQGSQTQSIGSDTASNFSATSDGHGGALIADLPVTSIGTNAEITSGSGGVTAPAVWGPTAGTADPPTPSLQWLENLVETVVSDLYEMKPASGFQHLLNQIEGWRSSSGSGSASLDQTSPSGHSISGVAAGWQSYMVQALASFGVGTGGPSQGSLIQPNDQQSTQGYLTVPNHS
jgi:hypothetical protein